MTATEDAVEVLGEVYQLLGQFIGTGIIPQLEKWLDNVAAGRVVHAGLLPVVADLPPEQKISHAAALSALNAFNTMLQGNAPGAQYFDESNISAIRDLLKKCVTAALN